MIASDLYEKISPTDLLLVFFASTLGVLTFWTGFHYSEIQTAAVVLAPVALLLGWRWPKFFLLAIVCLVPLDIFAVLSESSKALTLFKVLFPLALIGTFRIWATEGLPPLTRLDKLIFFLGVYVGVASLATIDWQSSLHFLRRFYSMIALYFTVSFLFRKDEKTLVDWIIISSVVSVFFGLYAVSLGENIFSRFSATESVRITGASNISPNHYAAYMLLPLLFSLDRALGKKLNLFWLAAAALSALGIVLSYSRGGFLATGFSLLAVLLFWQKTLKLKHYAVALLIGVVLVSQVPQTYWERISSISAYLTGEERPDVSAWRRSNYFKVALKALEDRPLTGTGPGTFAVAHAKPEYQPEISLAGLQRRPHDLYVQILGEFGLVGVAVFSIFLYLVFRTALSLPALENYRAIKVAVFGFLFMCLFIQPLLDKPFWVILALLSIAHAKASSETPLQDSQES